MPRRRPSYRTAAPGWLMTYGDMMSLILVFFIFVCSVKGFRIESPAQGGASADGIAYAEHARAAPGPVRSFDTGSLPGREGAGAPLLVSILFESGKDELPEAAKSQLSSLAPALWSSRVPLVVAGYVSPRVDRTKAIASGDPDRRAFDRALEVIRFLEGSDSRLRPPPGAPRQFLPASGGFHGGPIEAHAAGAGDGRDRVDIYPVEMERG